MINFLILMLNSVNNSPRKGVVLCPPVIGQTVEKPSKGSTYGSVNAGCAVKGGASTDCTVGHGVRTPSMKMSSHHRRSCRLAEGILALDEQDLLSLIEGMFDRSHHGAQNAAALIAEFPLRRVC